MRAAKQKAGEKASAPSPKKLVDNGLGAASNDERLLAKLRAIVTILEGSSLGQIQYEDADIAITLSKQSSAPASAAIASSPVTAPSNHALAAQPRTEARLEDSKRPEKATVDANDVHIIRSPFIGTFYRSPTPEAEAFIEVGKPVRRGQTLCIIEAMKLMNEIESEVDGVVAEVFVENGKTVQYGDALFKIKTKSS